MHDGNTAAPTADPQLVIEWAPFRLAPGVDEQTLLEVSEALQREFLQRQQGFVRRELLRGRDGQWADLVYWTDEASANAVMPAVGTSPACQAYFSLMVGADTSDPGAGVLHLQRIRSYQRPNC